MADRKSVEAGRRPAGGVGCIDPCRAARRNIAPGPRFTLRHWRRHRRDAADDRLAPSQEPVTRVGPRKAFAVAAGMGLLLGALPPVLGAAPASAEPQVYVYTVLHPSYGRIGTLTDTVDRSATGRTQIDSRLRIAVELMGVVLFRQQSDVTEVMHGDRLISLDSITNKDGKHLEVHGKAEGNRFVVDATTGFFSGPASTAPSDPWALERTGPHTLVYTSTGHIRDAQVTGGQSQTFTLNGSEVSLRHFVIDGFNRQEVWLDSAGIPVMVRSVED